MSELVSVGAVVLAGLVHASLQLGLSALTLLYHESAGRHVRKKTYRLVGSFISGVGIMVLLGLCATCFLITGTFEGTLPLEWVAVFIGVLVALAVAIWTFYYRRGRTTELWLPKVVARFIDGRAKETESDTEAFALGVLTCFAEVPFIFVLMIVAANNVLDMKIEYQILMVVVYTILAILPLLVLRFFVRTGRTAVDIQKWRVRNKTFLRFVSGVGFLVLAGYLIVFRILI
jgi:hypothetical protein